MTANLPGSLYKELWHSPGNCAAIWRVCTWNFAFSGAADVSDWQPFRRRTRQRCCTAWKLRFCSGKLKLVKTFKGLMEVRRCEEVWQNRTECRRRHLPRDNKVDAGVGCTSSGSSSVLPPYSSPSWPALWSDFTKSSFFCLSEQSPEGAHEGKRHLFSNSMTN